MKKEKKKITKTHIFYHSKNGFVFVDLFTTYDEAVKQITKNQKEHKNNFPTTVVIEKYKDLFKLKTFFRK